MLDIIEAIKERRSIHEFSPKRIEESILQEIFNIASWAPNHRMKQPWQVLLFQESGSDDYASLVIESYVRNGLTEGYSADKTERMMKGIKKFLVEIPHHALIYMEKDMDDHKYEEDYAAVCAFIQNVQLAAWAHKIGVLWTSSPYIHDKKFIEGIGLNSDQHKIVGVLQMGYPKKIPRAKNRGTVSINIKKDSFIQRN
ncbi:nitroreductase family protein [Halobacillus campisalis]|uniref:Nitroreductase n=1 Tax=Halobacillus campisalis TaxID=435909 RepID=A0ABW2K6M8_9BACI|nr:nitroreductase [Halobacillus campisalis]